MSPQFLSFCLLALTPSFILSGIATVNGAVIKDSDHVYTSADTTQSSSSEIGLKTHSNSHIEVDVVVIGGGFSGLTSAYELHKAGIKVALLEAKDRLGGRSRSQRRKSGPGIIEMGATWINNITQPEVFALTQKFGLETAQQYTQGDSVFQGHDKKVWRMPPGSLANTNDPELMELEFTFIKLLNEAVEKCDIRKWDDFPRTQDVSVAEWFSQKGIWAHPHIQGVATTLTAGLVGRGPYEVGAQYFFDYIKSGGGLENLNSEGKFGAQSLKVKQGTTAIAMGLANSLKPESIHLNTPAAAITQSNGFVLIRTATGAIFKAKKAIIAIPTNTYADIKFSPSLPLKKNALVSHTKPGIYAKLILSYVEPWWREAGLVGEFTSTKGPVCFSWDTSDPLQSQYSLAVFVAGDAATKWHRLPENKKEAAILDHLATLVGSQLAEKAQDVIEINYTEWTKEEYIGGAPTSSMGPGLLRKYGKAFRQPFGGLHFGGGETAYEWKGYLEGAVTAGQRAAKEVIDALGTKTNE